jgi:hypothetical protein
MTDKEFEELSLLAQFCKDLLNNPGWANLCEYVEKHRVDPIDNEILNATLSPLVPTFELFCWNEAVNKGKKLGLKEFMKVVPFIISEFEKESNRRQKHDGAGPRKPVRTGRKFRTR